MKRAQYEYVEVTDKRIIIRDIGNHNVCPSVTNGAEDVVSEVIFHFGGSLSNRHLYYYDSDGQLDELVIKNGRFAGFAPGPKNLD